MVGAQGLVLKPKELVGLDKPHVVVLQRGAAHPLGLDVGLEALEAAVGVGEAILEDAFEARFGVVLSAAAALFLFEAAVAAAEAVLEEETGEGESCGDDGAAAEGMPEGV